MAFLIALLILYTFFVHNSCFPTDTITQNKFLRDGETIVSNGGDFALGFFSPSNSQKRYIGIWFKKVSLQTVVWVANRNNPINNSSSGVVKIDHRGNLAIFDGNSSNPVWSTNISIPITEKTNSSTMFYKLLDTGNLVFRDESRGGSPVLWQSFDYPTDTLLPGMKLGLNLKSGLIWSLRSWKSPDDPSTGNYSTSVDRRGPPEFYLQKGPKLIWRTGLWNRRGRSGIPKMLESEVLNNTFLNHPDEVSFTYSIHNTSIVSRFVLDYSGTLERSAWLESARQWIRVWIAPGDRCDYYRQCGVFGICNPNNAWICSCLPGFAPKSPWDWYLIDGSLGCVRKREFLCGEGDGFLKLEKVKLPYASNARLDMSLGIKECEMECRNNCSCTGYASAYVNGSGCLVWFGDLIDIREFTDGAQKFFLRVDAIELENSMRSPEGSFNWKKLVLLLCSKFCWVTDNLGLCLLLLVQEHQKERILAIKNTSKPAIQFIQFKTNEEASASFELPCFDIHTLAVATENFSPTNKLGSGGFGSVYKGKLSDGRDIAVKRLSKNSRQGVNEFRNELLLIAKLQHRNLVRILGCCIEKQEKMLIYEYMPNKSLDLLLFGRTRSMSLDWKMRYDIILGIARGVLYLHQDSRLRIIHRDLKASNILLDADMNPKISDFGMAKIFGANQTQANTKRVVGTYGYMSPEYAMDGVFSIKSDVFSFGVLLLEIISGRKNSEYYREDPSTNLIKHAWELWTDGRALELVDSSMGNSFPIQEVLKLIQVGILCVQESANDRPTMSNVIFMLSNKTRIQTPKQPAFVLISKPNSPEVSTAGTDSHSINEMSTTINEGR
ncbi:hypothetical protein Syun_027126 [Stephania yunnanensis]|uniref:Receptor-like serine/threonine-protein kinase n=1 Tax=Stephania yunnanensis TaxID=152371 RepID=A0AAP0EF53_9MAGN